MLTSSKKFANCDHAIHIAHAGNTWEKCPQGCVLTWTTEDLKTKSRDANRAALTKLVKEKYRDKYPNGRWG